VGAEHRIHLDSDRLVFIDETATNTKMVRHNGRTQRCERCRVAVPFGRWKTITVTAGLRISGLTAIASFDGSMTGAHFRGYVEQTLVPALRPGDAVVLDNLPAYKISGIRARIEAAGARLLYLPAFSPTSTRSNLSSPSSRPSCAPRQPARPVTSGTPSNARSDAS
jgi:hypothetical protein